MNYTALCQVCTQDIAKAYVRCLDCEIFLCSQCDYEEHLSSRDGRAAAAKTKFSQHKRLRICDECEEQECAFSCKVCEQELCKECDDRLHQKGARQKHKRQQVDLHPEFIKPEYYQEEGEQSYHNKIYPHESAHVNSSSNFQSSISGGGPRAQSENSPKYSKDRDTKGNHQLASYQGSALVEENESSIQSKTGSNLKFQSTTQQMISPTYQKSHYSRQPPNTASKFDKGSYYTNTGSSSSQTKGSGYGSTLQKSSSQFSQEKGRNVYNQNYPPRGGTGGTSSSHNNSTLAAEYSGTNKNASGTGGGARGSKGSGCYSSGGSSSGSHHNSYSYYSRGAGQHDSGYYQKDSSSYSNNSANYTTSKNSQSNSQQHQSTKPPQAHSSRTIKYAHPPNSGSQESAGHSSKQHYNGYQNQSSHYSNSYTNQNNSNNYGNSSNDRYSHKNSSNDRAENIYNQYGSSQTSQQAQAQAQNQDFIPPQFFEDDHTIAIPIWQPLVKCEQNQKEMLVIQKELFNFAAKGELLIESNLFLGVLADRLQIQENECQRLIDQAVQQKIIHQTSRNFMKMKTLVFLSPKLDIISHQCICWAMQSLKRDEMTPTEKTLQNRIKEAFAFKISTGLWDMILQSLESTDYRQSQKEKNKPQIQIKIGKSKAYGSSYNEYYNDDHKGERGNNNRTDEKSKESIIDNFIYPDKKSLIYPLFKVKDIEEDPSIGQMTKAIYIKEEDEWIGVDQNVDDVDYILYDELKTFLQEYFCSPDIEDDESNLISQSEINQGKSGIKFNHTQTTTDQDFEEVRAIAGGRYGCAQFVKLCGPFKLKNCSLGRLAQLVQYAVKEDVLRYHKTLLVWTTSVDKHKRLAEELQKQSTQNAAIAAKLEVVKSSLIEILAESKNGMSLAQLPLYLRRKLPFALDLNELGFPKLKDLILSMSDKIKLELKGHNHPFAYLIKVGRYVHATSSSDDFQMIPKSKTFIKTGHSNLSEDVNVYRHLKNTIAIPEDDIQTVLKAFINIMRECPVGYDSDKIQGVLSKKLDKDFSFKNYGCNSLLEFLKKYITPTMDIEVIYNDNGHSEVYLIRSRSFFGTYLKAQQLEQEKHMNLAMISQQNQAVIMNQMTQQFSPTNDYFQVSQNYEQRMTQPMMRQDSGSSSLNISSQCYIPNHQSLYGGSTSANTSAQINVSHIRFNTADTLEMQQRNEINSSINPAANPFSKPPKHPQIHQMPQLQQKILPTSHQIQTQQKTGSFKTYPPVMIQSQISPTQQSHGNLQQVNHNQIKHQQTSSNATSFSLQSYIPPSQPYTSNHSHAHRGFFLSPSQIQMNKLASVEQPNSQNPSNITSPLHSRAISFNNSAFGGQATLQSATSKSTSQDFSIQSKIHPSQLTLQTNHHMIYPQSQSGFTSPNTQANLFGGMNFQGPIFQNGGSVESTFGSPVPGLSFRQYDSNNAGQFEESPPFNQEDDDGERDFHYLEKLVGDDEIDFKSGGDDQSQISIQSPQLSAVGNIGLRLPISNFNGYGPGLAINQYNQGQQYHPQMTSMSKQFGSQIQKKQWGSFEFNKQGQLVGAGLRGALAQLQTSNSCKSIIGIAEGGSSSSEENKRPSTVQEQRTEEDAEDNQATAMILNQKWQAMMNSQSQTQVQESENILFSAPSTQEALMNQGEDYHLNKQQQLKNEVSSLQNSAEKDQKIFKSALI